MAGENPILEGRTSRKMEKTEPVSQGGIKIHLPVKIDYHVLETYLRKRMTGEKMRVEKENGEFSTYAEITGFSLERSRLEEFDLAVFIRYKTLTTFFRNREGEVLVDLSLYFDEEAQEVLVTDYKLKGNSAGWLMNKVLPSVINTFLHKKLKSKMKFAFKSKIEEQVKALNAKLEQQVRAGEGIYLSGGLNKFKVSDIIAGSSHFLVSVEIEGAALAEIKSIEFGKD